MVCLPTVTLQHLMTQSIPQRLRLARLAHGWALLPLTFMLLSLPFPPSSTELMSFALLLCCVGGSAAVVYGITRRRAFASPIALLLSAYGVFGFLTMVWRIGQVPDFFEGPAVVLSYLVAGSVWISYVVALVCFVGGRLRPQAA